MELAPLAPAATSAPGTPVPAALPVMALLRAHLPLSLLVDLALAPQVSSDEVFRIEAGEATWLRAAVA